ncbi:MAG: hypothetical protein FWC67_01545 [Defluviitaleaceae bacterium]|nr:hypothetical protein [Defluviitaleaceae bacterium]
MLTNLFYYSHYRDYAVRTTSGKNSNFNRALLDVGARKASVTSSHASASAAPARVQLNKSMDTRILQYVKALGENVVTLKDSARMFVQDAGNMDFTAGGALNFESHLRWIDEDLRSFANSYNNLGYLQRLTPSHDLNNLTHSIRSIAKGNDILLSHLGIITADEGGLSYHGIGHAATKEMTIEAATAFKSAYDAARDFLIHPMSHHMEFKDLSYYYNYTIGNTPQDTFRLLESGILLDVFL